MVNTRVYHGSVQFGREKSERQDDPKLARLQVLKAQSGFQTSGYDENDLNERKKRLAPHVNEDVELSLLENSKVAKEQLGYEAVELEAEERRGNRELLPSQKRKQLVLEKEYKHTTAFGKGAGLEVSNGMYPGGLARLEYMDKMMNESLPK